MKKIEIVTVTLVVVAVIAISFTVIDGNLLAPPTEPGEATMTITDDTGGQLAVIEVSVADTSLERYRGLSETESLPPDTGMLFVWDEPGQHAFVMRDMAFPLDIVFVDENGVITAIHEAPVPPAGTSESDLTRYSGFGKWVIELPRGYMADHGVDVGDHVEVEFQ